MASVTWSWRSWTPKKIGEYLAYGTTDKPSFGNYGNIFENMNHPIEQDHDITAVNEIKVESNISVLPLKTLDGTSQHVTELADKSPEPETLERTVIPGDTNASLGTTIAKQLLNTFPKMKLSRSSLGTDTQRQDQLDSKGNVS